MDFPDEVREAMLALGRQEPPADGGIYFMFSDLETTRIREQLDAKVRDAERAARFTPGRAI